MTTLDINMIRDFLISVGSKVEYPILVKSFKQHLYNPDPAIQGRIRTQFKDYVNRLATVSVENNMKFIILRPEFRPTDESQALHHQPYHDQPDSQVVDTEAHPPPPPPHLSRPTLQKEDIQYQKVNQQLQSPTQAVRQQAFQQSKQQVLSPTNGSMHSPTLNKQQQRHQTQSQSFPPPPPIPQHQNEIQITPSEMKQPGNQRPMTSTTRSHHDNHDKRLINNQPALVHSTTMDYQEQQSPYSAKHQSLDQQAFSYQLTQDQSPRQHRPRPFAPLQQVPGEAHRMPLSTRDHPPTSSTPSSSTLMQRPPPPPPLPHVHRRTQSLQQQQQQQHQQRPESLNLSSNNVNDVNQMPPPRPPPRRRQSTASLFNKPSMSKPIEKTSREVHEIARKSLVGRVREHALKFSSSGSTIDLSALMPKRNSSMKENHRLSRDLPALGSLPASALQRNGSHITNRSRSSHREDESDSSSLQPIDPMRRKWAIEACNCNYNGLLTLLRDEPKLASYKDIVNGYTALHWAAKFGNLDIIKLIAGTHQVSPNIKSSAGHTPLHVAYIFNRLEAANLLLLSYKAKPDIRDHSGKKPLQYLKNMSNNGTTANSKQQITTRQ